MAHIRRIAAVLFLISVLAACGGSESTEVVAEEHTPDSCVGWVRLYNDVEERSMLVNNLTDHEIIVTSGGGGTHIISNLRLPFGEYERVGGVAPQPVGEIHVSAWIVDALGNTSLEGPDCSSPVAVEETSGY